MRKLSHVVLISLLMPIYQAYGIQAGNAYLSLGLPIGYASMNEAGHFSNFYQTEKLQQDVVSDAVKEDWAIVLTELQKQIDEETASMDSALKAKLDTAITAAKTAAEADRPSAYTGLATDAVAYKFATMLEKELEKDSTITKANKTTIDTAIKKAITDTKSQLTSQAQGQVQKSATQCYFQMFCPVGFLKDIWHLFFTDKGVAKEAVKFERNFGVSASIGYAISDYIRAELEASMQRVDLNKIRDQGTSANASSSQSEDKKELRFTTANLMINSYLNMENDSNFVPYVGAGAGVSTGGINEWSLKSFGIAYQGMAGLDVNLFEELIGFIEYQYFGIYNFKINSYVEKASGSGDSKDTEKKDHTGSLRFNYKSHAIKIGAKFLF